MFIFIINPAVLLSVLGLILSILSIIFSYHNYFEISVICFMYAGLADLFDGFIARKIKMDNQAKHFGREIDSIIDIISFGVTPVVILIHSGMNSPVDYIIYIVYCLMATMRLAYFNVTAGDISKKIKYYTGLPVTYVALILPITFLLKPLLEPEIFIYILRFLLVLIAFFFILKIKIPKPGGIFYIIFPLLAFLLTIFWIYQLLI